MDTLLLSTPYHYHWVKLKRTSFLDVENFFLKQQSVPSLLACDKSAIVASPEPSVLYWKVIDKRLLMITTEQREFETPSMWIFHDMINSQDVAAKSD